MRWKRSQRWDAIEEAVSGQLQPGSSRTPPADNGTAEPSRYDAGVA
jgi:hypothetical protein